MTLVERLAVRLEELGWQRGVDEFCEYVWSCFEVTYPCVDFLNFICDPSEAKEFCRLVRYRIRNKALPDKLILRVMLEIYRTTQDRRNKWSKK